MKKFFKKYKSLSYEQKMIAYTIIGICFSSVLACGKLIVGLFTDYTLCGVAVYSLAFVISKLECVLGIKSRKRPFKKTNLKIALFLLFSSLVYIAFNCRTFFVTREAGEYTLGYVAIIAFISFAELGFAIAGLYKTKSRGHFYRDIKIINFGVALTAVFSTQITILDFTSTNAEDINALTGAAVGGFIALCSVYILIAPRVSVVGRERCAFILTRPDKNKIIDMGRQSTEILLCRSFTYGSCIYRAEIDGKTVDGGIERAPSLWKRMPVCLKILCCILSEILIFVWLFGRLIFFARTLDLPGRLQKLMAANGFTKTEPKENN